MKLYCDGTCLYRGRAYGSLREALADLWPMRWHRRLTAEESMEIELRLLREMAERYGGLLERARRERGCTDVSSAARSLKSPM